MVKAFKFFNNNFSHEVTLIQPTNLRNVEGKYGDTFVSAAGVAANILLAIVAMIFFKILYTNGSVTPELTKALFTIIGVNVSLAIFNLMPIPPFDGMAILQSLFPRIRNSFSSVIYSPFYLILAIILASFLFVHIIPFVFMFINNILI